MADCFINKLDDSLVNANLYCRILVPLVTLFLIGCGGAHPPTQAPQQDLWRITEIAADRGHDIMEAEDGSMYHNTFFAIVLHRNDETLSVLYENQLPADLSLQIGDAYRINGLRSAPYSSHWGGYWLHDLRLIPATDASASTEGPT